jgi:hypothetical protein
MLILSLEERTSSIRPFPPPNEGGLSQKARGHDIAFHLYYRAHRFHNSKVYHALTLMGTLSLVITLERAIEGNHAQIDSHYAIDNRDDDHQTGPFHTYSPAQAEHHGALILRNNL